MDSNKKTIRQWETHPRNFLNISKVRLRKLILQFSKLGAAV